MHTDIFTSIIYIIYAGQRPARSEPRSAETDCVGPGRHRAGSEPGFHAVQCRRPQRRQAPAREPPRRPAAALRPSAGKRPSAFAEGSRARVRPRESERARVCLRTILQPIGLIDPFARRLPAPSAPPQTTRGAPLAAPAPAPADNAHRRLSTRGNTRAGGAGRAHPCSSENALPALDSSASAGADAQSSARSRSTAARSSPKLPISTECNKWTERAADAVRRGRSRWRIPLRRCSTHRAPPQRLIGLRP
jgi:hypothetical protein